MKEVISNIFAEYYEFIENQFQFNQLLGTQFEVTYEFWFPRLNRIIQFVSGAMKCVLCTLSYIDTNHILITQSCPFVILFSRKYNTFLRFLQFYWDICVSNTHNPLCAYLNVCIVYIVYLPASDIEKNLFT